MRQYTIWT